MAQAKSGDKVKVHYRGTLKDGNVFDSSFEREEPLEFEIGSGMLIKAFEDAVVGMEVDATTNIDVQAADAYGEYNDEYKLEVPKTDMPEGFEAEVGTMMQGQTETGDVHTFTIIGVEETSVTLDGNHPLAGQDLSFEIQLVEIVAE